ncbi:EPIDERMAL PATTERNING FACTOR-like protein 5 [Raphanus sativus]|uniref:Epidermal patterning factor-like protein n=1 Tax=Raphanus sativus TaxID=3726 RepID=A0A6J0JS47_RAPSA|nr:EPIDERMAL PATTERNING FACTOR-like protein 5 [Raphanus sativus]KAJ4887149.1 EPIDERMAL PATTERNING FACTOR-like protein 5 [Raphanus sativus]
MGVVLRRYHRCFISTLVVFTLLFLSFPSSATASRDQDLRGGLVESRKETVGQGLPSWIVDQKRLGGPGSAPPICRSKCGKCEPCKAVHVPIQAGLVAPLEYYPEAWRCKCGNKIFMP